MVIAFLSGEYAKSDDCMTELRLALHQSEENKIPFIPCFVEPYAQIEKDLQSQSRVDRYYELFRFLPRTMNYIDLSSSVPSAQAAPDQLAMLVKAVQEQARA